MTPVEASLSERLADNIVEIIRSERLGRGDALASSRELARRFGVTTPTVREALRRLEATGVVEFRHGSGTYVGPGIGRRLMANPHLPRSTRASVLRTRRGPAGAGAGRRGGGGRTARCRGRAGVGAAAANALHPPEGRCGQRCTSTSRWRPRAATPCSREAVEALLHVRARDQMEIRHRYNDRSPGPRRARRDPRRRTRRRRRGRRAADPDASGGDPGRRSRAAELPEEAV